jgi:hypothetical protein
VLSPVVGASVVEAVPVPVVVVPPELESEAPPLPSLSPVVDVPVELAVVVAVPAVADAVAVAEPLAPSVSPSPPLQASTAAAPQATHAILARPVDVLVIPTSKRPGVEMSAAAIVAEVRRSGKPGCAEVARPANRDPPAGPAIATRRPLRRPPAVATLAKRSSRPRDLR